MKISVSVDQVESGLARLIDLATGEYVFTMPIALLPVDTRENDILEFDITKDNRKRDEQQEVVEDLLQELLQGKHLR